MTTPRNPNYQNPFLPQDCQDNPFSDPFGDGSIAKYANMELTDEEEEALGLSTFTDGCVICWAASGFTTKFTAGNPKNELCPTCKLAHT